MINNILKKIEKANEVQEVKLEKHEVELALFDEIKTAIEGARKMKEEIIANFEKANGGLRYCDMFDKSFNKALNLAKEVGLNIPQDVMKLNEMNNELRSFFTKIKTID